jgi:hypothetical protein
MAINPALWSYVSEEMKMVYAREHMKRKWAEVIESLRVYFDCGLVPGKDES